VLLTVQRVLSRKGYETAQRCVLELAPGAGGKMCGQAPSNAVGGIEGVCKSQVAEREVDRLGGRNAESRIPEQPNLSGKEK